MDDCYSVVRAWYEQSLAAWREAGLAASISMTSQEGGLETTVVEFRSESVLALVATWSSGTVESIILDTRVGGDPRALNEEFTSHSELRSFLDRSSARLISLAQTQRGATS